MTTSSSQRNLHRLLFFVALGYSTRARAQRVGWKAPEWARNNMYGIASDGPMLSRMLQQPGFNASAHFINAYVSYVDNEIRAALRNGTSPNPKQNYRPCTVNNDRFPKSIDTVFARRGLPVPVYDCITDVIGTRLYDDRDPLFSDDAIFYALENVKRLLNQQTHFFIKNILLKWPPWPDVLADWSDPSSPPYYPWTRQRKRCRVSGAGFMRVNKYWYMNIGITNAPNYHKLAKWKRQSMQEYVYVGPGGESSHSMRQRMPTYETDDKEGPSMDNATTTFGRGSGTVWPAAFYPITPNKNPTIIDAMAEADLPIRQTNDALSPSTMSILFLPLVMNFVPVALITDTSTTAAVLYVMFSDVFTVVPLIIKGIEIFVVGMQRFRSIAVRVENDSKGLRNAAAAGQIWTTECRADLNLQVYGIAFISIGIIALVVGIWLENWAIGFVARRAQRRADLRSTYIKISKDEKYETYAFDFHSDDASSQFSGKSLPQQKST